jgi:hypothetical protein
MTNKTLLAITKESYRSHAVGRKWLTRGALAVAFLVLVVVSVGGLPS